MKHKVMIQYFELYLNNQPHLWNILKKEAKKLSDKGITAVWMPPAYKGIRGNQEVGYGVYDVYDLGEFPSKGSIETKYGTKKEYLECIEACHQAGLNVYSDIVLNHKMGADSSEKVQAYEVNPVLREQIISDLETIEAYTVYTFPKRHDKYSTFHWNWECFNGTDYDGLNDRHSNFLFENKEWNHEVDDENENFDYLMGADLDFSVDKVIEECKEWGLWYLNTCHNDGFRLDAVKHISAYFFKDWLSYLRKQTGKELFAVGEYWHGDINHLLHYLDEVDESLSLFDVPLHYNLYNASSTNGSFDMRTIFDHTLVSCKSNYAVTFVDNHDTQPSQGLESFVKSWFKPQAYALILLRDEGYPCIFYGDYYGIPYSQIESISPIIDEMLALRRDHMAGERHDYFDHPDLIGWSYEGENNDGFVVIMTNAAGGTKIMYAGKQYSGQLFTDGNHDILINEDGSGEFICDDGKLNIYKVKETV